MKELLCHVTLPEVLDTQVLLTVALDLGLSPSPCGYASRVVDKTSG